MCPWFLREVRGSGKEKERNPLQRGYNEGHRRPRGVYIPSCRLHHKLRGTPHHGPHILRKNTDLNHRMQGLHRWQHPRNNRPFISILRTPQSSPTNAWKTKGRYQNHSNRHKQNMHIQCENPGRNSPASILIKRRTMRRHDL